MKRLWVIALASVAIVVACDQVPLTSPTGSTITIAIDREIVPLNGQAVVTAIITESAGTPVHNGTTVIFQPSNGRMEPVEAQTHNGRAVSTFIAPSVSGTVTIHAFSGAIRTGSGNSSGGVTAIVGAAAAGSVTVTAQPAFVSANGGTVTISALVLDTSGNALPSIPVQFSTEHGQLGSSTSVSDATGRASTTLTTNRATRVDARVSDKTSSVTVNILAAPLVTIAASGTSFVVGVPVAFTVTPNVSGNASPIQTVAVDFGDGSTPATFNRPTGTLGLTHIYNRADGYTVTATATDVNGQQGSQSIGIVVTRLLPTAQVTMNPTSPTAGSPVAFTITATPATNGPPIASVVATADGVQVYSATSGGSFFRSFPSGTHVVEVTVTDSAGSVGRASLAFVVP